MPLKRVAQGREPHPPREQQEPEGRVAQPVLEPFEDQPMEPGRPYQAYVEGAVRKYWQEETGAVGSLAKPTRGEIRATAMPILCRALRNRPGSRRHQAVAALVQHAHERGWIKSPFSEPCESPSYIDAMIELVRDARWSASLEAKKIAITREIERGLQTGNINSRMGDQMMAVVRGTDAVDMLCALYDLLARITRQFDRARLLHVHFKNWDTWATIFHVDTIEFELDAQPVPQDVITPEFTLEDKYNLDARAVKGEIKLYLRAFCHPFISQAVNDMEFGRGKPVASHPGLLLAMAGISGVGNCSIFYYENEDRRLIRIVGIGYQDWNGYRLEYAAGELAGSGHKLRLSHWV